jgi:hypothetical protein
MSSALAMTLAQTIVKLEAKLERVDQAAAYLQQAGFPELAASLLEIVNTDPADVLEAHDVDGCGA